MKKIQLIRFEQNFHDHQNESKYESIDDFYHPKPNIKRIYNSVIMRMNQIIWSLDIKHQILANLNLMSKFFNFLLSIFCEYFHILYYL